MIGLLWSRLRRSTAHLIHQPDWPRFAGHDWPARIMDVPVTDRFHVKQGRSIGRLRLRSNDRTLTVYLKRHYRLPRWAGLLATLFPSRPWSPGLQEWQRLEEAARHGVPVPRPVAAGQWAGPWGRLRGFLAVEELTGELALHEAIPLAAQRLPPDSFVRWKRGLMREMLRLVRMLHERSLFHNDLYLCHFYISEADTQAIPASWSNRVHLIDLHRLCRRRFTSFLNRAKDLAQLLYSSQVQGVTDRDRLFFWQHYRGASSRALLRWAILFKCRLYRRHNAKRRRLAVPSREGAEIE
jgi:hypothetical protein